MDLLGARVVLRDFGTEYFSLSRFEFRMQNLVPKIYWAIVKNSGELFIHHPSQWQEGEEKNVTRNFNAILRSKNYMSNAHN